MVRPWFLAGGRRRLADPEAAFSRGGGNGAGKFRTSEKLSRHDLAQGRRDRGGHAQAVGKAAARRGERRGNSAEPLESAQETGYRRARIGGAGQGHPAGGPGPSRSDNLR